MLLDLGSLLHLGVLHTYPQHQEGAIFSSVPLVIFLTKQTPSSKIIIRAHQSAYLSPTGKRGK